MRVTALLLLSSLAITARAQSCSKPVGGSDMNLKDEDIVLNTFPDGSSVSFVCGFGYKTAGGSATITCTSGRWSTLQLSCEKNNCGALPEVDYADVNYPSGGTLFNDKAVITCKLGYVLVGKNEITCGNQGWMGRPPVCEVVKCPPPGDIANGYFNPAKEYYSFSEVVTYQCNDDLVLSGSKQLKCSENEHFQPGLPKCISVECKDPNIENAEFAEGSRPPHKYMATVTYKCKRGYKMIGASTLSCHASSKWSPEIPKCIKKDAPKPPNGGNALVGGVIGGLIGWCQKFRCHHRTKVSLLLFFFLQTFLCLLLKLALVVLIVVGVIVYRKLSTKRSGTDKDAAKDGEDVALS